MRNIYRGNSFTVTRSEAEHALKLGGSIGGAARIIGCSYTTMRHILCRLGVETGAPGRPCKRLPKARLAKYRRGHTWEEIAAAFGCSTYLVRSEFARHGWTKGDERSKKIV